jgi:replication initiation protein RepC
METSHITTPFGRRALTLGQISAQARAKARAPGAAAHKWTVFRALSAARERLGLSERSLAVLDALLSFHPETVLSGDRLVVFPSNAQLSLRAHGMPASTLRRHLSALVEAGVVIRRDSPNGKRYARKGQGGEIAAAFGFDLSPLVARADEFAQLAGEVRAQEQALRCARERLTLLRRDLAKMIATGAMQDARLPEAAGQPSNWNDAHAAYRRCLDGLPRAPELIEIERATDALARLSAHLANALELHVKTEISSANESRDERHIQNSNPKTPTEFEPPQEGGGPATKSSPSSALALPFVLKLCPDIADYARGEIAHWRDLTAASNVARGALGVSFGAWEEAQRVLGERDAAIAIAAILQRGAAIASAGGYLRTLTRKAQANVFSVTPMLMALASARRRGTGLRPNAP